MTPQSPALQHRAGVRAVLQGSGVVIAALLVSGCAVGAPVATPSSPPVTTSADAVTPAPTSSSVAPTAATPAPLAVGVAPARVMIPSIELDEPLIALGLNVDGGMQVPADFDDVGWFTGGGRPGGHGPLVIAGHVDSLTGSAVFMRLRELAPEDTVTVTDIEGAVHTYRVVEVADYAKASFPTMRVFGATATDELRLITCGGDFDASVGSYEDNRVVYAVRA